MDWATFVLPAALLLGAPTTPGTYEKGLFCETAQLVERVVERADRGIDPVFTIGEINHSLARQACVYSRDSEIRARTVKFERTVAANHTVYAIYRVDITAFGHENTEIGRLIWNLPRPLTMYTLRAAQPEHLYDH